MLCILNWVLGEVLTPGQGSAPHPQPAVRHSWPGLLLTPSRVTPCCLTAARASSELPIASQESVCAICHFWSCSVWLLLFLLTAAVEWVARRHWHCPPFPVVISLSERNGSTSSGFFPECSVPMKLCVCVKINKLDFT